MPDSLQSLPVTGTVTADSEGTMLVLSERLGGHDTFLTGQLQLDGAPPVTVRILTFDDVTVLRLTGHSLKPFAQTWAGVLHLPHGWRTRSVPQDLATAASADHRDLGTLDDAELRYALTFLEEAQTTAIRQARIDAILVALPQSDRAS
jgi:hypothetical protein